MASLQDRAIRSAQLIWDMGKRVPRLGMSLHLEPPGSSLLDLLTIETWKFSSRNTRGHLYKHNPKPATLLQPELCCSGTRVNCCPHLRKELELEPLQWRGRQGKQVRRRSGDLPQGECDLLPLSLCHVGGGGSILRGGLSRLAVAGARGPARLWP